MEPPVCPKCGARHAAPHPWCKVLAHHRAARAAGLLSPLLGLRKVYRGKDETPQDEDEG